MRAAAIRSTPLFSAVLFLVGAFVLYWNALKLTFLADDLVAVWRIGVRHEIPRSTFFRPLSEWSLVFNDLLSGPAPAGYRAFNVLVHGINAWLVMRFIGLLFPDTRDSGTRWIAVCSGLLFLCYPFHGEPVIWIVGRGASLATLFTLLALSALVRQQGRGQAVFLTSLLFFLGMLAYETAMLFPLFAGIVLHALGADRREVVRFMRAWSVVFVVHFILRMTCTDAWADSYGAGFFQHSMAHYIISIPKVLGRLFLEPHPDASNLIIRGAIGAVVIGSAALVFLRRTRGDTTARSRASALALLLLVSLVVPVMAGVSTRTSESDRFLYMPSVFACALLAMVLGHLPWRWSRNVMAAAVMVGCVFLLMRNTRNWINASTTIEDIIAEVPRPVNGRIFILGLPGEVNGAFVFRHGFHEALLLADRDTMGIFKVDTVLFERNDARGIPTVAFDHPNDTAFLRPGDPIVAWTGAGFTAVDRTALNEGRRGS